MRTTAVALVIMAGACAEAATSTEPGSPSSATSADGPATADGLPVPPTTSVAPPTSVEDTSIPEGYVLSSRERFPGEATSIEQGAMDLFGSRLALIAEASTTSQAALAVYVVSADSTDIEQGADLATENVGVEVRRAVATHADLRMVASAINDELTASGVVDGFTVGILPLEQIVTVGTPPSADPEEVDAARVIAADVIDREAQRIAADRPETVDIEEPWSASVLRLMTVTATNANDAPIG